MPIFDDKPDFLKPEPEEDTSAQNQTPRLPEVVETGSFQPSRRQKDLARFRQGNLQEGNDPASRGLILDRLLNETGEAEGPNVAPEVKRGIRVIPPTQFQVVHQVEGKYCTRFILSWLERPEMALWQPQYAIYTYAQQTVVRWHTAQNLDSPIWDGPLQDPLLTTASPCEVVVWGYQRQPVVFAIQTRLSNGLVSSLDAMPTCAAQCDPYWFKDKIVTASYSCTQDDETILVDATAGPITITLFDCRQLARGHTYTVKQIAGFGNAVTVQGAVAGQNIDGAATYVLVVAWLYAQSFRNDRTNAVWRIV